MTLRRLARRWAAAGVLATLSLTIEGSVLAQNGILLPKVGSDYQSKGLTHVVRSPDSTLSAAPPIASLPSVLPAEPPLTIKVPDDGLGALPSVSSAAPVGPAMIPPATPPMALPGIVSGPVSSSVAVSVPVAAPADFFANMPPVQIIARPGEFPIAPVGPGFYTLADALTGNERQGPPKYPYPRVSGFIFSNQDVNWTYLDKPDNTETDFWDFLKRQRLGPNENFLFTTGGEFRARYNHEENSRAMVKGKDNTYDTFRLRAYADLSYQDRIRFFVEGISAFTPDYRLVPLVTDRNNADLQQAFVDVKLFEFGENPVWFRVGRQELCYGSQRLISPLDWVNTRRTFQGAKLFYRSEMDDLDLFVVQPIVPNINHFDSVDNNRIFAGAFYTHRPSKNQTIDAYYLFLDNTNTQTAGTLATGGIVKGASNFHTIGGRLVGDADNFLYDFEGGVQFGGFGRQIVLAGFGTAGVGYHFKDAPANPIVWAYYDYASGDDRPGVGGTRGTFNQLFPFGHYYFGFADIVGRQNINDISAKVIFWPDNWLFTTVQFHAFFLDSARDSLYNAGGNAIRTSAKGTAGTTVGQEIDFVENFHLTNHSDILFSYSYLFAGSFLKRTATNDVGRQDVQALYVQYSYRW